MAFSNLQPQMGNAYRLRHPSSLGSSLFARRYWGNRGFSLFLRILRCFSSSGSPLHPMYSDVSSAALPALDCSIRKSPDQSLFDGSPRLIAAYHVLLRLLVPRYPSYSLSSLTLKSNPSLCSYQRAKRFTSLHYWQILLSESSKNYPSTSKT